MSLQIAAVSFGEICMRYFNFCASKTTLSVLYLTLEKAKTTLFAFSHCAVSVGEKGEFARFIKSVPLNIAQRGKNRRRAAVRRMAVVPLDHGKKFCQIKTFCMREMFSEKVKTALLTFSPCVAWAAKRKRMNLAHF